MEQRSTTPTTVLLVPRDGPGLRRGEAATWSASCRLLVCTTCLQFYGLEGRLRIGTACGMPDILSARVAAAKVITI
jgi:hypothetical protein